MMTTWLHLSQEVPVRRTHIPKYLLIKIHLKLEGKGTPFEEYREIPWRFLFLEVGTEIFCLSSLKSQLVLSLCFPSLPCTLGLLFSYLRHCNHLQKDLLLRN